MNPLKSLKPGKCCEARRVGSVLVAAFLTLVLAGGWTPAARAQSGASPARIGASVDSHLPLFTTMCALHAAGYERDVSAAALHPVRARVRSEMLRLKGPAVEAIRKFYREHRLADNGATLSRYVSFALLAGPPPNFAYLVNHDQLPPDVLALEGFGELLAEFYREAKIEELWRQVQPEYEREIQGLREPLGQILLVSSSYLREIVSPGKGQSFTVVVEPLVGGKTSVRNFGDRYSIVLSPSPEVPLDDIRHAYLHFLLDALTIRYRAVVRSREALLNYAARAPRLPVDHKDDFPGFVAECLVKAVELRLGRWKPEKLEAALNQSERDGYVLVRPLHRELINFEKAAPSMNLYFPDLIRGIRVPEEAQRLEKMEFAPAALVVPEPAEEPAEPAEVSEVARWLVEGDRQIAQHDGPGAAATFERVLEKQPGLPRGLYGMAFASVLQGEPERAKELFLQVIQGAGQSKTEARLVAWSHVYLGRIHDVEGKRELALSEYRAALAVEGAPESARQAAQRGVEKGYEPAARGHEPVIQRP